MRGETDDTEDAGATVRLTAGGDASADELRSSQTWLNDVDEVRGRAEPREGPPVPGTLGPLSAGEPISRAQRARYVPDMPLHAHCPAGR